MSSDLVRCRYNQNHRVKNSKLLMHEMKCPSKDTNKVKTCSYDPSHKVPASQIASHEKTCPRRPPDEPDLMREMSSYVNQLSIIQREEAKSNSNRINLSENSINSTYKSDKMTRLQNDKRAQHQGVVGMRGAAEKKKILQEEKDIRNMLRDDITENMEDSEINHVSYPELEIEVSKDKSSIQEEKKFESFLNNKEPILKNPEYDPNASFENYERNNIDEDEMESEEEEDEEESFNDVFNGSIKQNSGISRDITPYDNSKFLASNQRSREGGR